MKILKIIGSVVLAIAAILVLIYNEKERKEWKDEGGGEINPSIVSGYGAIIVLLMFAGFLFFSVFD